MDTSDRRKVNLEDTKRFIREEETNARYNPSTDLFDSFTCVENIIEGEIIIKIRDKTYHTIKCENLEVRI